MRPPNRSSHGLRLAAATALTLAATACATAPEPEPATMDVATQEEWRSLASPRPDPVAGAPRVSFSGIDLAAQGGWPLTSSLPLDLGISELVVAGLLRRRDVEFVERRRFGAAVDAERSLRGRPAGAPAAGVSPGAEFTATAAWLPLGGGRATVEIRLTNAATGAVAGAGRRLLPDDADPVAVARAAVATMVAALAEIGRLPPWDDPLESAAPDEYRPSGVPLASVQRFLEGLAAEERWNWEPARRSYGAASATAGFFEAEVALARTARLRMGGTLGES